MDKIYVDGIRIFSPHDKAPDFVKGSVVITPRTLIDFLKTQEKHLTDYKGAKQLRCQLLEGKNGLYLTVDTYKPSEESQPKDDDDDLPF